MWFVEPNGGGYRDISALSARELDTLDLSRVFITLVGAQRHPDGIPATGIRRIYREAVYAGAEIIANDWKVAGLTPCGYVTHIELEE